MLLNMSVLFILSQMYCLSLHKPTKAHPGNVEHFNVFMFFEPYFTCHTVTLTMGLCLKVSSIWFLGCKCVIITDFIGH